MHGNQFRNNGYDAADALRDLGISGADIVWDGSQWNNRFDEPGASRFPPLLPGSTWPDLLKRAYWQILNFAITKLL